MITYEEIEAMMPDGYKCFDIRNEATRTVHMKDFSFYH